jgi:hypothetical protein
MNDMSQEIGQRAGGNRMFLAINKMRNQKRLFVLSVFGIVASGLLGGCDSSAPPTESQRQDAILADPMGYKPEVGRDIMGGDGFDKDAFLQDFRNTFDP